MAMKNVMNLLRAVNVPLRPLLYAAGAAATVAGIYYYIQNHNDEERAVNTTNTYLTADPEQTLSVDVACLDRSSVADVDEVSVTPTDSDVPEDSLSETEDMNQRVDVSRAVVDREMSDQEDREMSDQEDRECERESQVCPAEDTVDCTELFLTIKCLEEKMEDHQLRVNELGDMLCIAQSNCDKAKRRYAAELRLRKYITAEHLQVEEKYHRKIGRLQITLSEAEKKLHFYTHLSNANTRLKSEVDALKSSVEMGETELTDTQRRCEETIRECKETNQKLSTLQSEYNEMKRVLLKGKPELHHVLMSQNAELGMLINEKEDLIKIFEKEHKQAVETNEELEHKNKELISKMNGLRDSVQELERQISETHRNFNDIQKEYDQAVLAESSQKMHCSLMSDALKHCSEALKEREQAIQKTPNVELSSNEEFLKVALAKAERKYQEEKRYTNNLEKDKFTLLSRVNKLQVKMQNLDSLYAETNKKYQQAEKECAKVTDTMKFSEHHYKKKLSRLLSSQESRQASLAIHNKRIKEAMCKNDRLKTEITTMESNMSDNSLTISELEYELTETQERRTELQRVNEEKGRRLSTVNSNWQMLNDTILTDHDAEITAHHNLQLEYNRINEQHEELLKMCHKKQEDYSILKSEYDQMKETLLNNKESQSISHAKAEDKCDRVMESSVQLENKKSDLMAQVNTLQSSVQQMKEELSQTHRNCEELTRERDQELEAHNILKSEYDQMKAQYNEMMETVKQCSKQLNNHPKASGS